MSSLLSAGELTELLGFTPSALLDVRWELATGARRDLYEQGHIPGAVFVDLDSALSGSPGAGGRHPLPTADAFGAAMRAAGVDSARPVVVYDAATSMAAARAWWLLRYFGHGDVRVLDGGLAAWARSGFALEAGPGTGDGGGDFTASPGAMPVLDAAAALRLARDGVLLDAREAERFRGESEPIDPVAGHIPGARNRPTSTNVNAAGEFLAPGALREAFAGSGVNVGAPVGAYCGSGISATHEVLALELAGYSGAALYPGSWSEWVSDPARPVATGP
ncbi:MAG: sulfurtransferase [Solirubrobacteraceae bacterium]